MHKSSLFTKSRLECFKDLGTNGILAKIECSRTLEGISPEESADLMRVEASETRKIVDEILESTFNVEVEV